MEQNNNELQHYGVPGMKWGKRTTKGLTGRMVRGHGGPGIYLSKKRQLASDKRDLEALKRGEHLSVGFTKKRQAAYDKRDKTNLEKRIAKTERQLADKQAKKQAKEQFKADVKVAKKIGIQADFKIDKKGNLNYYNHSVGGRKITAEYANTLVKKVGRDRTIKTLAGTAGVVAGANIAAAILSKYS